MEQRLLDICGTSDRLALLLSGGKVHRYHQDGQPQPISEHTWRVLVLLIHFWPLASRSMILVALYHDVAERYTGDIPSPVKRHSPQVAEAVKEMERDFHDHLHIPTASELTVEDQARISCADYLELCITCKERHGRRARQIYERGVELVEEYARRLPSDEQAEVLNFVRDLSNGTWEP